MQDSFKQALERNRLLFVGLFLITGVASDFIMVGIFKVIWFAIYATTYIAIAMTIESRVRKSQFHSRAKLAVFSFLGGTLLAHLFFVDHHRHDTYMMTLTSEDPLIFSSPEFPELLYVTSDKLKDKLKDKLSQEHAQKEIPMHTDSLTDYDCMKTFAITDIDGVDIRADTEANWTLRFNKLGVFTTEVLPSKNDNSWPWCKISFYRTNQ
jgi:hypothetical protein